VLSDIFYQSSETIRAAGSDPSYLSAMDGVIAAIVEAFKSGHKLLVFGNGGSAADAQHICAELVGRFVAERPGLPAIALTTDPSFLTAWSNDYSFDTVFARQIQALGEPGDIAWGISTSGNSCNVVAGLQAARKAGLTTIGLTGRGGGKAAEYCDHLLAAPSCETARIQEVHLVTYHAICGAVEQAMFGSVSCSPNAVPSRHQG
jgi:D-sedoheptulose 7-phosphate isomerase